MAWLFWLELICGSSRLNVGWMVQVEERDDGGCAPNIRSCICMHS